VKAEPTIRAELEKHEQDLDERERAIALLYEKFEAHIEEAEALQQRIDEINDDLRKYRLAESTEDALKQSAGSRKWRCPTCHQEVPDSLLDTGNKATPMTVDQNVSFYQEQIKLFIAVHASAIHNIETAEKDLHAHRAEITQLKVRIRFQFPFR